jgi:hypothetical protein
MARSLGEYFQDAGRDRSARASRTTVRGRGSEQQPRAQRARGRFGSGRPQAGSLAQYVVFVSSPLLSDGTFSSNNLLNLVRRAGPARLRPGAAAVR